MSEFAGTGTLIRFILRRDRVRIPVWIGAITLFVIGSALALPGSYPTAEDRQARADVIDNPATIMILGPGYGLDDYTFGAMMANEMLGITAATVAVMSILMVVRHTRAEEESGRLELVRASVAGKHAGTAAALIAVTAVNLLLGGIIALGLAASLEELDLAGSLLFGAALALTGIVFAAIAAVAAQINEFARGATGMSVAVLAGSYLLRGFGDLQENFLSWLLPVGWAQQTAPYVFDRWWPLALSLAFSAVTVVLAFALSVRRDVAAGIVPPRPGPVTGSPVLSRPLGLPLRLQRGSLISWAVGLALFAAGTASVSAEVADMYTDNPTARDYLEQMGLSQADAVDSALAVYIAFVAMFGSIYTVGAITRLRAEESSGRADNVLATAVGKPRWAGEYLAFSIITSTLILAIVGFAAGLTHAAVNDEPSGIASMMAAALSFAPAHWLAAGVALAVFGLFPRAMAFAWAVPGYAIFVLMLGPLLGLPDWLYEFSPFEHVPRLPAADFTIVPLAVMTVMAVVLAIAGLAGFSLRDVNT